MNVKVLLHGASGEPLSLEFPACPLVVGRESGCDLFLPDPSISRRHARLALTSEGVTLDDLGSTNGTFLNDRKVDRAVLHDGDRLRFGGLAFTVRLEDDAGPSPRVVITGSEPTIAHKIRLEDLDAACGAADATGVEAVSTTALLGLFQQAGRILESAFELEDVLQGILAIALRMIPAERGFVLLADPDTGEPVVKAQRFRDPEAERVRGAASLSGTILRAATVQGEAVLTKDATLDERFGWAQSVVTLEIRGAICVPLRGREMILGAVYVDSRQRCHDFTVDDLKLLAALGAQLGIAVENARLHEAAIRTERLAAVGEAVASLGHCIKNILNGMEGGGFFLERGLERNDGDSVRKGWDVLKRNSDRLKDLMLDMLAFSKPRAAAYEPSDPNVVAREVAELMREKASLEGVDLRTTPAPDPPLVVMDPKGIYRALLNLVTNAIESCSPGSGVVEMETRVCPGAEGVRFLVRDNGCGMEPDDLARLGRAFFSTKGAKGTGLGLSVAYRIVAEHGGRVEVDSTANRGTTFTVTLPARGPDREVGGRTPAPAASAHIDRTPGGGTGGTDGRSRRTEPTQTDADRRGRRSRARGSGRTFNGQKGRVAE